MVEVIRRGRGFLFGFFVLLMLVWACDKDDIGLGIDWNEGVVHYMGAPELDGCGWMLFSEGVEYSLYNMPEEFLVDGLDVWFKGKELREYYACGLSSITYKIYEIREVMEKPWEVRPLDDYPDYNTSFDMFFIDSAYVDGDSLRIDVGYSGGCTIHQFNLWALDNGSKDSELHIMLEHISNGDMCEASFNESLAFSLVPIQEKGKSEVGFWLRGNPTMSSLLGNFTYEY